MINVIRGASIASEVGIFGLGRFWRSTIHVVGLWKLLLGCILGSVFFVPVTIIASR